MSYCQVEEIKSLIKSDAINAIIGDEYIEDEVEKLKRFNELAAIAIDDADSEIDGYLAKRYPVPLKIAPKSITKISKDIAVYNLYSRQGLDENDREKNILNRYKTAINYLIMVSSGKADLDIPGNNSLGTTANKNNFKLNSSQKIFNRDNMKGY